MLPRRTCVGVLVFYCVVLLAPICAQGPLHCGGHNCEGHHDACQYQNNGHLHCGDPKHCHGDCTPEHHDHGCCCHNQDCIDHILLHGPAGTTANPFAQLGSAITCGPDICSTADEPFCVLHHEGFRCDHHCDEHHRCNIDHPDPPDPHGHIPDCCCHNQTCVDFITSHYHLEVSGIRCPDCSNYQHNECHGDLRHRCAPHELCNVITNTHGIHTTHCQRKDDCLRESIAGIFQSINQQFCCDTQSCLNTAQQQALNPTTTVTSTLTPAPAPAPTNAAVSSAASIPTTLPMTTTTATPLYCPMCTDAFIGACTNNSLCASDEGCMLLVTAGKLQTGCMEIGNCQYHERIGDSICCSDKNCTDYAFRNMQNMSFTCPTCHNTQDPQSCIASPGKCSYLSKGCMLTHSENGISSGCNTHGQHCKTAEDANSVLCNVHPIPFAYKPGLQCSFCCHKNDSTCILDALGVHDVTPPPASGPTAGSSASCVDHDDSTFSCQTYNTQYGMCSSTNPLMVQLVDTKCRKTCGQCPAASTAGTPLPPCVDKIGTCAGMASFLCTATDPSSQTYAKENCAKTCNLCVTLPTTTVIPCVDTDSTCAGLATFLCSSPDPVSQAYAKQHCAKTCNLCSAAPSSTTPATPASVQCVDHDLNNNCMSMGNALCTSQESHVKNFAIATCAKTCNLCTEYFSHLAGLTIPLIG